MSTDPRDISGKAVGVIIDLKGSASIDTRATGNLTIDHSDNKK
jgi:hypothetical protein